MVKLVLYCKSFSRDILRCARLLQSVLHYNKDKIPFYISVPKEEVTMFKSRFGTDFGGYGYEIISDEDIMNENLAQSWKNQQVVKMLFWKAIKTENYVVLDSDSYFIKDFYYKDFLVTDSVPYTVMHEQKDLFQWTARYKDNLGFNPQQSFAECRTPIQELFDRKGRLYDGGPVPVIWNRKIWESLEDEYLNPNDLTFNNLIETVPSEFSWYLEWMLSHPSIIPLYPIEPIFKVFHYLPEYHQFKQLGYTIEHWSSNYLGVCMQSSSGLPLEY